jgi:hypothetical protein
MPSDEELLAKLERWLVEQPEPPNILDVIRSGDRELAAALILRGFRAAAREAVLDRLQREGRELGGVGDPPAGNVVLRIVDALALRWGLPHVEKLRLLELREDSELGSLRTAPVVELPIGIIERTAVLLDIFQAISTLLPEPPRADAWFRKPNGAPVFNGQAALDVMLDRGLKGLREVRAYLQGEIWGR